MKKACILLLSLSLALMAVFPPESAQGLFDLLEMPTAEASPSPTPDSESLFSPEPSGEDSDSQELFAALQTPEPTPFPTPEPRADTKGSKKSGDYTYLVLADGSAEIIAYNGKATILSVPDTLKKHPVTAIGVSAFAESKKLTELILPEGLRSIGDWAFGGCEKLAKVTLPEGLETVGAYAFADCPALRSINIPCSVTGLGEGLFDRETPGAQLTVELEKGSFADTCSAAWVCELAYVQPVPLPTPTPTETPEPTQTHEIVKATAPIIDAWDDDYCQTCGGLGGCPAFCLNGEELCQSSHCSFGRCTECNGGVIKEYDFHGGIKTRRCSYCNNGNCKICNGTGRVPCRRCGGTGRCPTCGK